MRFSPLFFIFLLVLELATSQPLFAQIGVPATVGSIQAAKQAHSLSEVRASHVLQNYLFEMNSSLGGLTSSQAKEAYCPSPPFLTATQRAALNSLRDRLSPDFCVRFDEQLQSPSLITGLNFDANSSIPSDALSYFVNNYDSDLSRLFRIDSLRSLSFVVTEMDDSIYKRFSYSASHVVNGIPIEGDYIRFNFILDTWLSSIHPTLTSVESRWHSDISNLSTPTISTMSTDEILAILSNWFPGITSVENINLTICTLRRSCYGFPIYIVSAVDGHTPVTLVLDAFTGDLIDLQEELSDTSYSGVVKIGVLRPYEACVGSLNCNSSKVCTSSLQTNCHPLPYAPIYEDAKYYTPLEQCSAGTAGDFNKYLGSTSNSSVTDYHGAFSNLTPSDPTDLTWVVDGGSGVSQDPSPPSIVQLAEDHTGDIFSQHYGPNICNLYSSFSLGASQQLISYSNSYGYYSGIRNEAFYHINYASKYYLDIFGSPAQKIRFDVDVSSADGWPCGSIGKGGVDWIILNVGRDVPNLSACPDDAQVKFREVIYHEFGHNLMYQLGDHCSDPENMYCQAHVWKETASEFAATLFSRLESGATPTGYIGADRLWPDPSVDYSLYTGDEYGRASIFSSIWIDYILSMGDSYALTVFKHWPSINNETVMVGYCNPGNDFLSECPTNSFLAHFLAKAEHEWPTGYKSIYEASLAFHRHIKDAYPHPCNSPEPCEPFLSGEWITDDEVDFDFPFYDDVTDVVSLAPLVPMDRIANETASSALFSEIDLVPDNYRDQQPWFTNSSDLDRYAFFGRAGIEYLISTEAYGCDTVIDLMKQDGAYVIHCTSGECDDCVGFGSCLYFTPTTSDIYVISVRSYPGTFVGHDVPYHIRFGTIADDFADTALAAHPVAVDGSLVEGYINRNADSDWFYFYLKSATNTGYKLCGSTPSALAIFDENMNLEQLTWNQSSCSGFYSSTLAAGLHYVQILGNSTIGQYSFNILANQDLDGDLPTSPFDLGYRFASTPGPTGSVKAISTGIEDSGDVDWYRFYAVQGDIVEVTTGDLGPSLETEIELFATVKMLHSSNGMVGQLPYLLAALPDSWTVPLIRDTQGAVTEHGARIEFVAPASDYYYIRVAGLDEQVGRYTIYFRYRASSAWHPDLP